MTHVRSSSHRGFALLEALIALILILVGLVAVSKLQSISVFGAGEGRTRAEAAHLTQQKLEQLRNLLQKGEFTALTNGSDPDLTGVNATFKTNWTVLPNASVPALEQHEVRVWTTWTDARGVDQRFDLVTIVAWDDPMATAYAYTGGGNPIAPTGGAQRGGELPDEPGSPSVNQDGTKIYKPAGGGTYLTDANDKVILFLPRKDNAQQEFTTISGRVLFDPDAGSNLPAADEVFVRLSSEGECIYTHTGTLPTITAGSKTYKYFVYTCYVGPGWYGNVGVNINSSKGPNVCVGDSGFNGGQANGTTISAHPQLSYVRTYRGFRSSTTASGYQSTGVKGGTQYGTIGSTGPSAATTFVNHDFLLADLGKKTSCATQMPTSLFAANAGAYVCISPDNLTDVTDQCPSVWPLTPTSGSGSVTYALTVTPAGNGTGNVTSDTGGIACGSNCSAVIAKDIVVVLTAAPLSGSTFDAWTNCPSGNTGSTCTLTMSNDVEVGAIFNTGVVVTSYTLAVGKSGSGTVTGSSGGINCGSACSATFSSGTSVTLTAVPGSGQTFTGWSGDACNGSTATTCALTMSANLTVQATFSQTAASCTTTVNGAMKDKFGTVAASPVTAGSSCSSGVGAGNKNYICTLQAPAGQQFTLRNFRTGASKPSDNYDLTKTVTANCGTQSPPSTNF